MTGELGKHIYVRMKFVGAPGLPGINRDWELTKLERGDRTVMTLNGAIKGTLSDPELKKLWDRTLHGVHRWDVPGDRAWLMQRVPLPVVPVQVENGFGRVGLATLRVGRGFEHAPAAKTYLVKYAGKPRIHPQSHSLPLFSLANTKLRELLAAGEVVLPHSLGDLRVTLHCLPESTSMQYADVVAGALQPYDQVFTPQGVLEVETVVLGRGYAMVTFVGGAPLYLPEPEYPEPKT